MLQLLVGGLRCLSNTDNLCGNLKGLTYGDVPLFRGTYFQKKFGIIGISFLNVRDYGYNLKKYAELWVPFWKILQNHQEAHWEVPK